MPGNVAPNFLCAKLLYKILSYRFGADSALIRRNFGWSPFQVFFRLSSVRFASAVNGESGNSWTRRSSVCCASLCLPASR